MKEEDWCNPITMYGCNKLYCEHLGRYYSRHYRQLAADHGGNTTSISAALRFPGLISAVTIPTGGTSDYGPEMLHHAAQGIPYNCFVRPDTRLPFMAMPDAIKSLLQLEAAPREQLSASWSTTSPASAHRPQEIYDIVKEAFPAAEIEFRAAPQPPGDRRQLARGYR